MFQEGSEKKLSVKKTFKWAGLNKPNMMNITFKNMSEDEVFGCLMNWVLNNLTCKEEVLMRFRVNEKVYQAKVRHNGSKLVVNKPVVQETSAEAILYDWSETVTYNTLNLTQIKQSIIRAEYANLTKVNEKASKERDVPNKTEKPKNITEEEWNTINELLEI